MPAINPAVNTTPFPALVPTPSAALSTKVSQALFQRGKASSIQLRRSSVSSAIRRFSSLRAGLYLAVHPQNSVHTVVIASDRSRPFPLRVTRGSLRVTLRRSKPRLECRLLGEERISIGTSGTSLLSHFRTNGDEKWERHCFGNLTWVPFSLQS